MCQGVQIVNIKRSYIGFLFIINTCVLAAAPVIDCDELTTIPVDDTVIESANIEGGTPSILYPVAGPMPKNCVVTGVIEPRSGIINPDTASDKYGIRFELRLPTDWNGRFFYQGGAALNGTVARSDGVITSQSGTQQTPALWRGYAVVNSDSGHQSGNDLLAMFRAGFGVDPQARVDYGYRSIGVVTSVAKFLINAYYGTGPDYSYFVGCSKGGQEAMQASQRYGDQFDGIVAGDPGFHLPQAAVNQISDSQVLAATARKMRPFLIDLSNGAPLLWGAFSQNDLQLVVDAVTETCDKLDGLADGLIFRPRACTEIFDPVVLTCGFFKRSNCLTRTQVEALKEIMGGVRNSQGEPLYSDFPYDNGLNSTGMGGWMLWKLGVHDIPTNLSINFSMTDDGYRYIFSTPPNPQLSQLRVNIDDFDDAIRANGIDPDTGVVYDMSAMDFMAADNTDLDMLLGRGGKLILYHGASDPVFSLFDTLRYYDALRQRYGDSAESFARAYIVPGMGHCSDGTNSVNSFDALTAIEDWVEQGIAPDRIIAQPGNTKSIFPSKTLADNLRRPLCPYPRYARYDGSGEPENADSFICSEPE
jgi:feruloyl esterase